MKRILMFITVMSWLIGIYFGYIFIVRKTMKSAPQTDIEQAEDQGETEKERQEKSQREKAQEMRQQQKELMEERQRTFRQHQNR